MAQYKCDQTLLTGNDSGRSNQKRKWIILHTCESVKVPYGTAWTAYRLAQYQQSPSAGGSYHLAIDRAGKTCRINDDPFVPWASGNSANFSGFHICLNGWAAATRAEWLSYSAQIEKAAQVIAHYCKEYNIPCRWVTGEQMKAGMSGVSDHNGTRIAFGRTTHTDVGPNYPYDLVIKRANEILNGTSNTGDEMNTNQINRLYHEVSYRFPSRVPGSKYEDTLVGYVLNTDASLYRSSQRLKRCDEKVAAILKELGE